MSSSKTSRFRLAWAATVSALVAVPPSAGAQTFVQLTDLGSGIGPRLTSSVTRSKINRAVFGSTSGKVTFIDLSTVYQFTADPSWRRVIIWKKDTWSHEFTNTSGPGGRIRSPAGMDISARKRWYLADRGNSRVLAATFDPASGNFVSAATWSNAPFPGPSDVAWDGRTSPLTQDYLYVVDDSSGLISYWDVNSGVPGTPFWWYGTRGSGTGQFSRPTAVCVGKTPASNGGTQFTTSFYVVDRGNKRLVWLSRTATGPMWNGTASLGNWDPIDCAVDHFGHVYVADRANHRIHKFNSVLWFLDSYGVYGKGANNLNTFAWPHAISVPCGLKVVNSLTVWYCEGRVLTTEQWSDSSGAVEHYLGISAAYTSAPNAAPNTGWASINYKATDVAYASIDVHQVNVGTIKTLTTNQLRSAGQWTVYWDGTKNDGTRALNAYYRFRVYLLSAYGCPGSALWCYPFLYSSDFYFDNCTPSGGGGGDPAPIATPPAREESAPALVPVPDPCSGGAAGPVTLETEPTTLYLLQRVLESARPLARLTGVQTGLVAATEPTEVTTGSLTAQVRQFGVRGLRFGVTRQASGAPIAVRVYALSGRLVRVLVNEPLDPGIYEVGWDGLDDRGRHAGPGVYIAVMTAGSFRATQRLILRQP